MMNEKITYADLKLIEKDLHRELTDSEAALVYTKGWKALFEHMGMSDEKYVAYRRLVELLITYCTKDRMEFEKLRQSKDYTDAFALLGDFVKDCQVDEEDGRLTLPEDDENDEDDELTLNEALIAIIQAIPDSEYFWLTEYIKLDSTMPELVKFVSDTIAEEETYSIEEKVGDALDVIKDTVVEKTAARLAKTGEGEKLPEMLIAEVCEYIDKNWVNYSMQLVNGVLKIKKF